MDRLRALRRPGPLVVAALAYLTVASGVMIWRGISVSPDYLVLLMVPVALASGRFLRFLGDWVPFVALFLGYEAMRGIASKSGIAPHVGSLASAETWLFGGHLPSAELQAHLRSGALDYASTVVYFCHFAVPLAIGLALWIADRTQFLRYVVALLGMSFTAFVVFLLLPSAPPWMAQQQGYVHGFSRIIGTTLPSAVSPYYNSLNPNPVAAMPSLHAAFPFLGFLALLPVWPRAAYAALAWSLMVWFAVVYLGEHYAIDVFAGVLLVLVAWTVTMRVLVPRVGALRETVPDPGVRVAEPAVGMRGAA